MVMKIDFTICLIAGACWVLHALKNMETFYTGDAENKKARMAFDKVVRDDGLAARVATDICRALNLQVK